MAISNKQKVRSVGKDMQKLCTVGGNVKWCRYYGTVWQVLQKLKIYDLAISLLGICPKELKRGFKRDI